MNKDIIITVILIIIITAGLIVFTIGVISGDSILSVMGGVMVILPPLILKLRGFKRKRKSVIYYMEDRDKTILPLKRTSVKKKEFNLRPLILIFIAVIAVGLTMILMRRYVFKPTYITFGAAVNDGCAILNMGGCKKNPSEIIVNYDVNKDGIIGGIGDNLSDLLEGYGNCTGNCIRIRCGCP